MAMRMGSVRAFCAPLLLLLSSACSQSLPTALGEQQSNLWPCRTARPHNALWVGGHRGDLGCHLPTHTHPPPPQGDIPGSEDPPHRSRVAEGLRLCPRDGGAPQQDPTARCSAPLPGEPRVGLSSSRCLVWPCRCLKTPFLSDNQVFRRFSTSTACGSLPLSMTLIRERRHQTCIYIHVRIYMRVRARIPACRPTEPTVLRRQFGPNPPHAGSALVGTPCRGGRRPARRLSFLSCYQRSQSLSLPSLCPSLSLLSPPASPFATPPDNVAFLLQILNTCCPTALSRRDMCSLLPGSSVCALAEVCIPPALLPPPRLAYLPCRSVLCARVPHGDGGTGPRRGLAVSVVYMDVA